MATKILAILALGYYQPNHTKENVNFIFMCSLFVRSLFWGHKTFRKLHSLDIKITEENMTGKREMRLVGTPNYG